jgi:hypothetical protein
MNPSSILHQITLKAPTKFRELIEESERRLIATWESIIEEAELHEAKAKLKVSLTAVVDLDEQSIEYAVVYGGRHKLSVSESIEDPKQVIIPGLDGGGIIVTRGKGKSRAAK